MYKLKLMHHESVSCLKFHLAYLNLNCNNDRVRFESYNHFQLPPRRYLHKFHKKISCYISECMYHIYTRVYHVHGTPKAIFLHLLILSSSTYYVTILIRKFQISNEKKKIALAVP